MQERQRDGERGQSGDTEDSGLLDKRVEDNLELERVDSVSVPQEDMTENAVGGKTEDVTNTVGQMNGEGGQTGDTKESVVILLSVGKTKGQRSKMLKRVAAAAGCVGILVVGVVAIIITVNKYSSDSAVKNNLTVSETNHVNHTLERESQANQPKNKSCPSGWKQFGDSCYYKSTEQNSWEKSREQCVESGAHLVVINNKEEQEFIGGLGNEGGAAWIGLRRTGSKWTTWVDGTPLTSQYWHSGYPDTHDDDANCAYYYWHSKGEGGWYNVLCVFERKWICERRLT